MQIPTVKIRQKGTGRIKIINQTKYADNISAYSGWELVSMRGGNAPDALVAIEREQERIEAARQRNPNSPASQDKQKAFEARAGATINVDAPATDEQPFATEVTSAVAVETPDQNPGERQVAVIGGVKTVKVRGRRPNSIIGEGEVL